MEGPSTNRRPILITRMFATTRYKMTLAVVAVFVGAAVLLIQGIVAMVGAVLHELGVGATPGGDPVSLRVAVIEGVDVILVATVLAIIALTQALEPNLDASGRSIGFQIAAVTAALSLCLYQESRHHRPPPDSSS